MKRPEFDKIKNYNEFKKYRWTRNELIDICKEHGLRFIGTEKELNRVIESYFNGVRIPPRRDWYTNKVLCSFVNENGLLMFITLGILFISVLLCTIGIINKVRGTDDLCYIPHLVFGITGLIVAIAGIQVDRTLDVIKSYFPRCGDKHFTREQIDEQANSEHTEYLCNTGIFLAPEMVIGSSAGVAAVAYEDISSLQIAQTWHTRRIGMRYSGRSEEYYTYKIIIRTNKGKAVAISITKGKPESDLNALYEYCLKYNPRVRLLEMRESILAYEKKPNQVTEGEGVRKSVDKAVQEQHLTRISVSEETKKRFIRYKLGSAFMLIPISLVVAAVAACILYLLVFRLHHGRGTLLLLTAQFFPIYAIYCFIKTLVAVKKDDIEFYSGKVDNKYSMGYAINGVDYRFGYIEKMKPETEPGSGDRVIMARLMNEFSLVSDDGK